ncbi:tetratricopeptide repeat protein [Opitutus sp. ER46]|uniref:tetratricopeptide repeat protein n=1 Tax=Opitutus sp. ER46 TaxID=2161864 RepID=UPI000D313875|nr:tetratricopeptide repeat protein [Opitutus sp. ER46]PTX91581.1 hypothetical protein DB354_17045 [Opitutus sp. ER46]
MAANLPSDSKPTGAQENPASTVPALSFEEQMSRFWQKNRTMILVLCAVILVAIVGRDVWGYVQRAGERKVEAAFVASNTPEKQRAFIAEHPKHTLAAVAEVQLADEAYKAGKSADAVAGYDRAIAILKQDPLAARAQLGRALAQVQGGKVVEAIAGLKALADDAAQLKAVRTEAAYNLASLAAEAGNAADVQKYIDQLNQIDPASVWARRAMPLQAAFAKPVAPATPAAPKADAPAGVQLKLPGK